MSFLMTRFCYITIKCKHANLLESIPTAFVEIFSSSFIFHAGTVVARVQITKTTEVAYGASVKVIFDRCNQENKCDLAQTLKGIIVDWQDALGKECAEELLRGCKISMHSPCTVSQKYVMQASAMYSIKTIYRCSIQACL